MAEAAASTDAAPRAESPLLSESPAKPRSKGKAKAKAKKKVRGREREASDASDASDDERDERPRKGKRKQQAPPEQTEDQGEESSHDEPPPTKRQKKNERVLCLWKESSDAPYCTFNHHRRANYGHILAVHLKGRKDDYNEAIHSGLWVRVTDTLKRKQLGLLPSSVEDEKIIAKLQDIELQLVVIKSLLERIALKLHLNVHKA